MMNVVLLTSPIIPNYDSVDTNIAMHELHTLGSNKSLASDIPSKQFGINILSSFFESSHSFQKGSLFEVLSHLFWRSWPLVVLRGTILAQHHSATLTCIFSAASVSCSLGSVEIATRAEPAEKVAGLHSSL